MDRKSFSSVLDEAVGQLDSEVRALRNQQQTLTNNLKELESQRDKLTQEIIALNAKKTAAIQNTKDTIDEMMKDAQDKLTRANQRDIEANDRLLQANETIKNHEDLIKSNTGKEKNLEVLTMEAQNKISKLNMIFQVIKEHTSDV
jgi:chromosome segregation ATPase